MKSKKSNQEPDSASRKPRIVVAGEFSAGKSRLINGLLGHEVLPTNVTSTSMPPVWLSSEGEGSIVVDLDGNEHPIEGMDDVELTDTLYCRLVTDSPILKHFDLIDTPGNSDPAIPAICWERMIEYADAIVWCTGATQAWRQSEKAVCREFPEDVLQHSTLLITQADRMPDEKSANKVRRRVERDASKLFPTIMMASLIEPAEVERIASHLTAFARQFSGLEVTTPSEESELAGVAADAKENTGDHLLDFVELPVMMPSPTIGRMKWKGKVPPAALVAYESADMGPVRQLWAGLTDGKDLDDVNVVLKCTEELINYLDTPADSGDENTAKPGDQHVALAG